MEKTEMEKGQVHTLGEIIEYAPDAIVSKTLLKKPTGHINLISYDTGKGLTGKIYPFDTFVLLIEGKAEIIIDGKENHLEVFQGIIIPAHSKYVVKAIERFKMLSVIVKSGYE
jgi:hypothetical protein